MKPLLILAAIALSGCSSTPAMHAAMNCMISSDFDTAPKDAYNVDGATMHLGWTDPLEARYCPGMVKTYSDELEKISAEKHWEYVEELERYGK